MNRGFIIISILILILVITSFWFGRNREAPPWVKCKESLFSQVIFKKCTPSSFSNPQYNNDNDEKNNLENNNLENN